MEETIESLSAALKEKAELAGQLQYINKINEAQLQKLNQEMLEINQKAHKLKAPAPQAPEASPPPSV